MQDTLTLPNHEKRYNNEGYENSQRLYISLQMEEKVNLRLLAYRIRNAVAHARMDSPADAVSMFHDITNGLQHSKQPSPWKDSENLL